MVNIFCVIFFVSPRVVSTPLVRHCFFLFHLVLSFSFVPMPRYSPRNTKRNVRRAHKTDGYIPIYIYIYTSTRIMSIIAKTTKTTAEVPLACLERNNYYIYVLSATRPRTCRYFVLSARKRLRRKNKVKTTAEKKKQQKPTTNKQTTRKF